LRSLEESPVILVIIQVGVARDHKKVMVELPLVILIELLVKMLMIPKVLIQRIMPLKICEKEQTLL